MEQEIWKTIPEYEDYKVSNLGNVKSLKFNKEKLLKITPQRNGYLIIQLNKNGKGKTMTVHKLVAIAFLNHKPCGYELVVNHINFDRTDNRLSNLELISVRENTSKKHIKSSSKYTGVSWDKDKRKFKSCITINGKNNHLGYFINEEEASNKYQEKLKQIIL